MSAEEALRSQFASELRSALLFCVESTTLLSVINEYFSVNTLFVLVFPVRGRAEKNVLRFTGTVSLLSANLGSSIHAYLLYISVIDPLEAA